MAEDKRWWKRDKDSDTSKEDVEDLLNEAEVKRLRREEELAEAEHRAKMAKFTDSAPSTIKDSESGDGSPVEFTGQRIVLKPDGNGCFYVKGSIGNIGNINLGTTKASTFVLEKWAVILDPTKDGSGQQFSTVFMSPWMFLMDISMPKEASY